MFRDEVEITDVAGLLRVLAVADLWELATLIEGQVRLPVTVDHRPGTLQLSAASLTAELHYPFMLRAFWERLREFDERSSATLEECG